MSDLNIYNTLNRNKEVFKSISPGFVGIYVCGPTVYGHAHVGHAKSYISFDIIVRYLRYLGYKVRYVQNITDVGHLESDADEGEDKLAKQARIEKLEPMEIAENYTRSYFEDMDALGVVRPDIVPRASGHIIEQIETVKKLLEKGFAYEVNGNVYFDVHRFPEYGKLSGRRIDELESGVRVDIQSDKKHPTDFALWKKADPKHIMQWPSPWGSGYPGWHIECSVMSTKYLGETLDIHGGGLENIFPHHECEIAQSECSNGKPFANYWIHNNMVTVDGVKMGKSLGNQITVKDAIQKYSALGIRYFILTSHYRSNLDFSDDAINAAIKGLKRINESYTRLVRAIAQNRKGNPEQKINSDAFVTQFEEAMNDDFNTPQAIAALHDFLREINSTLDNEKSLPGQAELIKAKKNIQETAGFVLGIIGELAGDEQNKLKDVVEIMIQLRNQFRSEKNFQMSDFIRDELKKIGIILKDTPTGTEWVTE